MGNDTDVDNSNAQLSIASVTGGTGGTAVLNANGTVTFTPNANFSGAASFTYTVSDGASTSSPATVTVNVAAVNDAPVITAASLTVAEGGTVLITAASIGGQRSGQFKLCLHGQQRHPRQLPDHDRRRDLDQCRQLHHR